MIAERTAELATFCAETFGGPAEPRSPRHHAEPASLSDDDVLTQAREARNGAKFRNLWAGDTSSHGGDDSAADLALLALLAFWTQDADQLDRLFHRSGLYRAKWERADYRLRTINKALLRDEIYEPHGASSHRIDRAESSAASDAQESPSSGHDGNGAHAGDGRDTAGSFGDVHLSDLGNARRLVRRHGQELRYCQERAAWYVWDERRWVLDTSGEVVRRAKETVGSLYAEAAELPEGERRALVRHALSSEAAPRIKAMIVLAESEPGVPITLADLDRDPLRLNVQNGTIDLKTGELRSHDRGDLISRLVPVPFDPAAECPTWLAFLGHVLSGNGELIAFLQRAIGYSLTGDTSERCFFILWGVGRNGKSTLIETIIDLLADLATTTPTETLLATRDGSIPNDVAALKGLRFVSASEFGEGRRLAEAKLKELTGGDTVSARFMRGEFFNFRPVFKLWVSTNHKPKISGVDDAIWDRIRLIPFAVRIPKEQQDRGLRAKLQAEAPGILAWAVAGCLAWQRDGLRDPADVLAATNAYRQESDLIGAFIDDLCILDANASATAKDLYLAYGRWCEESGERTMSQTLFGRGLTERGFDSVRLHKERTRYWIGIGLLGGADG